MASAAAAAPVPPAPPPERFSLVVVFGAGVGIRPGLRRAVLTAVRAGEGAPEVGGGARGASESGRPSAAAPATNPAREAGGGAVPGGGVSRPTREGSSGPPHAALGGRGGAGLLRGPLGGVRGAGGGGSLPGLRGVGASGGVGRRTLPSPPWRPGGPDGRGGERGAGGLRGSRGGAISALGVGGQGQRRTPPGCPPRLGPRGALQRPGKEGGEFLARGCPPRRRGGPPWGGLPAEQPGSPEGSRAGGGCQAGGGAWTLEKRPTFRLGPPRRRRDSSGSAVLLPGRPGPLGVSGVARFASFGVSMTVRAGCGPSKGSPEGRPQCQAPQDGCCGDLGSARFPPPLARGREAGQHLWGGEERLLRRGRESGGAGRWRRRRPCWVSCKGSKLDMEQKGQLMPEEVEVSTALAIPA